MVNSYFMFFCSSKANNWCNIQVYTSENEGRENKKHYLGGSV